MRNPLLEPARGVVPVAVMFVALALGVGKPGSASASVIEEQATEAAAVAAARIADDEASVQQDDGVIRNVETITWSEPDDSPTWFPVLEQPELALVLTPSPMQTPNLPAANSATALAAQQSTIANEHTVIPLPPAAWTGLAGLASLGTIRARKAIIRFFT